MENIPTITIDLGKKCLRCKKGGATQGGYCLPCFTKRLKEGKYNHILKRGKNNA